MTKRFGLYVAAGLLAVAAVAAVPVLARGEQGPPMGRGPQGGGPMGPGPMGPGPGGRGGPGMRGPGGPGFVGIPPVDLSQEQREQVRSIMESHRDQMQQVGEKMRAAHEGMRALVEAETIDESAIRAKSVEVAAAEADAAILQAKVRAEVFAILTPEQQQKARELKANRPQGPGPRRPGRLRQQQGR